MDWKAKFSKEPRPRRRLARQWLQALTLSTALLLCPSHGSAAATSIPHGTLELVAERQWIPARHNFNLGLHFQLEKGWHIYWVNPGDSGEPPRVTWHLPAGLTAGATQWPAPQRLAHSSIVDFGYEDSVTLIVPIHADATSAAPSPAQLAAEVKVLVCREICIPGKAQLSLTLPVKSWPPAQNLQPSVLFVGARKLLPRPAPANWRFLASDAKDSLILTGQVGRRVTRATFFPLVDSQIDNAAPQTLVPGAGGFRLTLHKSTRLPRPIEHLRGVLVLPDDAAYVINVPLAKSNAQPKPAAWQNNPERKIPFV